MSQQDEQQQRTCRCCDRAYAYPVPKSQATRFYCASCMDLKPDLRETMELMNKRIRSLTSRLGKLEKRFAD